MENRQQRTLQALQRALVHLEQHPIEPEPPLLSRMKDSLTTSIDRLMALSAEQHTATRQIRGRPVLHMRQRMRREVLMPLVRIAKPLLVFAPGTEQALRVPHARADAATVARSALDMAKALEPHAELLASAGYPENYPALLAREAEELAASAARSSEARERRSRATAAIRRELKQAMGTLTVIEGILMTRPEHKGFEQAWRTMRRVHGRTGRPPRRGRRPPASSLATG